MTLPTADPYQRTLDLLDDSNFWDRYLAGLESNQSDRTIQGPVTELIRDEKDLTERSVDQTVIVLPTGERHPRSTRRLSTILRVAVAAAAGIGIIAGVAALNPADERRPIEVYTDPVPPAVTIAPALPTRSSEAVDLVPQPLPTIEPDLELATPEAIPTPTPPATPEAAPAPDPTSEPSEASPATTPNGDSAQEEPPSSDALDAAPGDESPPAAEADSSIDPNSFEVRTLEYINGIRRSQQLPEVSLSPALSAVAQEQAWAFVDHQDTTLLRHPNFTPDPVFNVQAQQLRGEAWTVAGVLSVIDIGTRLPEGWTGWDYHAGHGGALGQAKTEAANKAHVGEFTHVGIATASGDFSASTSVIIFANYPLGAPALAPGSVAVRTNDYCSQADRDLSESVIVVLPEFTFEAPLPEASNTVELRLCAGTVRDRFPEYDLESRYSVSIEQRSTGLVIGRFTCFVWDPCRAIVEIEVDDRSVNVVFRKLSPNDVTVIIPSGSMTYRDTAGEVIANLNLGFQNLEPAE